jgi:hypothetical protein
LVDDCRPVSAIVDTRLHGYVFPGRDGVEHAAPGRVDPGTQPVSVEASIVREDTERYAMMINTFRPLAFGLMARGSRGEASLP